MRQHPTAPVNVARISIATSGTDFTAPEADFAALIRAAASAWEITFVTWELQELGQRLVRSWRKADIELYQLAFVCWSYPKLAHDGLERELSFFKQLKGGVCTMCAPRDQTRSRDNQRE
jgi:hypothetical protein